MSTILVNPTLVGPVLVKVFLFKGTAQSEFDYANREMQEYITKNECKGYAFISATPMPFRRGEQSDVFMSVTVVMKKI